jgi:transposase
MGKLTSLEHRLAIKELKEQGLSDQKISEYVVMPYDTVREWRRRLERQSVLPQVGRPAVSCLSSFSPTLTDRKYLL